MSYRPRFQHAAAVGLALTLGLTSLAGCQFFNVAQTQPNGSPQASIAPTVVVNGKATLSGTVRAPALVRGEDGRIAQVVANSSSGVVANSSSGVVANSSSGVVANSSSGYRLAQAAQTSTILLQNALVYFTNPDETLLRGADGQVLQTTTDAQGRFTMPSLPENRAIVVTVLIPGHMRLVGYLNTQEGSNTLDIDLATTYVTEFLRDQARLAQPERTLGSYDAAKVAAAIAATRQVLDQNEDVPDLRIDHLGALRDQYRFLVASISQVLSDAWKDLLGYRPLAISPVETGMVGSYKIDSLAVDPVSGDVLVAGSGDGNVQFNRLAPDGTVTSIMTTSVGNGGLSWVLGAAFDPTGHGLFLADPYNQVLARVKAWSAVLSAPSEVPFDDGTLSSFAYSSTIAPCDVTVDSSGSVYASDFNSHLLFRLDQTSPSFERFAGVDDVQPDFDGDDGPAANAHFNEPYNVTAYQNGLYVTDCANQRVRRIDLTTGVVTTVLGNSPRVDLVGGRNALDGGFDGDGKAPGATQLNFPHKVAFDASGAMVIADTDNGRIRMVADGVVRTLVRPYGAQPGHGALAGEASAPAFGNPWYLAFDRDGNLLIADDTYKGRIWRLWLKFGR